MDISVVIPLYNEEESLEELYAWIKRVMTENRFSYEIVFVDDGSTDSSWRVISKLREQDPNIRAIRFQHNYGKSPACFCAFQKVSGDVVITMDAIYRTVPTKFRALQMIRHEGYDLVSG
jgi:glycosyltransferase involved in cell wall biosynthesis